MAAIQGYVSPQHARERVRLRLHMRMRLCLCVNTNDRAFVRVVVRERDARGANGVWLILQTRWHRGARLRADRNWPVRQDLHRIEPLNPRASP